jgi:hypothetical protein
MIMHKKIERIAMIIVIAAFVAAFFYQVSTISLINSVKQMVKVTMVIEIPMNLSDNVLMDILTVGINSAHHNQA